jgi:sulfur-oxidizing protein SoxY
MMLHFSRRRVLALGAGALTAGLLAGSGQDASAATQSAQEMITAFTGGKEPVKGKIKLDVPEIAENGNAVPLAFTVESPMTDASYVKEVLVLADGNPGPGVAEFHFSPASGVAEATTRIRLAKTQNVIVIAKTNDGSLFMDTKPVKVTIGGCGG